MKTLTKRSLNRCKDIWVVRTDYHKHSLAVSDYLLNSFSIWAKINRYWAHTLTDTGAIRNFMSSMFVKKVKISLQKKSDVYKVTVIDDKLLLYNNKMIDHKIEEIRLQIKPHVWDMQFNIMLTNRHDIVLELSWLQNVDLKISFWHQTLNFSTGKLVHMSKEMLKLDLQICAILTDKLKKKLWENPEQVKFLWSKQINLATIKLTESTISDKY